MVLQYGDIGSKDSIFACKTKRLENKSKNKYL